MEESGSSARNAGTLTHWFDRACAGDEAAPVTYLVAHALGCKVLNQQVDKLVEYLSAHSITAGHTVAVFTASSHLLNLMIHASAELGVTLYPLDPRLPSQWRQRLLENGGVDYLLSCDSNPPADLDISTLSVTVLEKNGEVKKVGAEVAIVIATSGSSGEPKGIMLEWDPIYHSAMAANHRLGLRATDCWLNCLPLYHIGGLSIIFRTVLAGASMVLHQGFDAMHVWQAIRRYQVTHISLVPVMLAKLLEVAQGAPPEHLRVVLVGGAALDKSLAQRALDAGWPLFVTYGMSETGSQVATRSLNSAAAIRDPIPLLAGIECSVVDANGVLTNGPGQIRLRGELLMRGYANPGHKAGDGLDGDGWFVTGDIGTYSADSGIQITGRADEMIISGGENIHPQQVEQLLHDCPGVSDLCVFGIVDPEWGERVCVAFSGDVSEKTVAQWCREKIAGALRPRQFVRLEALPRLSNGKIDRHTLKQLRI